MTNPFPFVRRGDKFTVRFIDDGGNVLDVECENKDQAVALANVRPFCEEYAARQPVDLQELQKSIDALERHAFTGTTTHGYLLDFKEDIQSEKIT